MKNRELVEQLLKMDPELEVGIVEPEYLILDLNIDARESMVYEGTGKNPFLYVSDSSYARQNPEKARKVIVIS